MHDSIRVLIANPGLNGRDRGATGTAATGASLPQTPERIVNAALEQRVQGIGKSIVSGANNAGVRTMALQRERNATDAIVIAGGIIPGDGAAHLEKQGVAAAHQPGASLDEIVNFIHSSVMQAA